MSEFDHCAENVKGVAAILAFPKFQSTGSCLAVFEETRLEDVKLCLYLVLQVGIFWELINIVKSPPFKRLACDTM